MISAPQAKIFEDLGEKLREKKILHEFITFFPEFKTDREIRVVSHNVKLDQIKKLARELQMEAELEMINKGLKPVGKLTDEKIKKLAKEYEKHFPMSQF